MMDDVSAISDPRTLRKNAERCFRLADGTLDPAAHEVLRIYGEELLDRAERMEEAIRAGELS